MMKNTKKLYIFIPLIVVVFIVFVYIIVAYSYSNTISDGTKIAGVNLSGKDYTQANKMLKEKLTEQSKKSVIFKVKDKETNVVPANLSIVPDYEKTIKKLTSFSLNPNVISQRINGNPDARIYIKRNYKNYNKYLKKLQEELGIPAVNAQVVYEDTTPKIIPSKKGDTFSVNDLLKKISKEWFLENKIILKPIFVDPDINDKKAKNVVEKIAKPLVNKSMTLKVENDVAKIPVQTLAKSAKFVPDNKKLRLTIDGQFVLDNVKKYFISKIVQEKDAQIIIENNAPKILNSVIGRNIDHNELSKKIIENASKKNDRNITLPIVDIKPKFNTQDAEKLEVKEVVGSYMIPIKGVAKRTNLIVGAKKINNVLLKPNETFSYNKYISPVTPQNGYVPGLAIVGASYGKSYGGGLCQLSTTLFNAAFLSGMKDVEHTPHTEYFDDYPLGRDAAYWEDSIDLKFKNDTPYGVVIQAYVEGWNLHVKLWSTKYYDVKTTTGQRYNTIPYTVRSVSNPNCVGNGVGANGFSVQVWRTRFINGKEHDKYSYVARYKPSDIVRCTKDMKIPENKSDTSRDETQIAPDGQ